MPFTFGYISESVKFLFMGPSNIWFVYYIISFIQLYLPTRIFKSLFTRQILFKNNVYLYYISKLFVYNFLATGVWTSECRVIFAINHECGLSDRKRKWFPFFLIFAVYYVLKPTNFQCIIFCCYLFRLGTFQFITPSNVYFLPCAGRSRIQNQLVLAGCAKVSVILIRTYGLSFPHAIGWSYNNWRCRIGIWGHTRRVLD